MTDPLQYKGDELKLFQHAKNWKKYFSTQLQPYIKGRVLEVGAGIAATTLLLNDGSAKEWILLEPDKEMSASLKKKMESGLLPPNCLVQTGTIEQVNVSVDTIIYIDVLEHIERDARELQNAALLLNKGGVIIVLSPAFNFLYNPFDKAIGHYRRYNKKMLKKISPAGLTQMSMRYYDSTGYFAALMNKLFLRKKYPTQQQVLFWDNWLVPISTISDQLFFHSFGKSIIAVWNKPV